MSMPLKKRRSPEMAAIVKKAREMIDKHKPVPNPKDVHNSSLGHKHPKKEVSLNE